LTKRQIAVLAAIGDGFATKEIAAIMKTSPKTVERHRANLYRIFPALATGVKLARLAIGFGLSSLCLMCVAAAAQPFLVVSNPPPQVQLAWSPPTTGVPSFYNVYWGTSSGQYTNALNVGNVTNVTLTVPTRGVMFVYAVTAVDSHGLQSIFSNEVSYTAPNPPGPPTQKPLTVITVMKSTTPTGIFADAGMNWSDTPTQPQVYYKLKIDHGIMLSAATPPLPSK
jgi:hypothetical protein